MASAEIDRMQRSGRMLTDVCRVCGSTLWLQRGGIDDGWHHLSTYQAIRKSPVHAPEPESLERQLRSGV
jgi:hypothetical protein